MAEFDAEALHQRYGVPRYTLECLERWSEDRLPPGGFISAVLRHDLFAAVAAGDPDNLDCLVEIVQVVYNYLPADCHGSREAMEEWAKRD